MIKLLHSFKYAIAGIKEGMRERNMRVHLAVAILVIIASLWLRLSSIEWAILIICIGLVIGGELFNTAIEETCNAIRETDPQAYGLLGVPKDIAAGAVLVAAITAALAGLVIFVPHLLTLLK